MLTKEQEMMAFNGVPMPILSGLNSVQYLAIFYISKLLQINAIDNSEASNLKNRIYKELENVDKTRQFEARCWENSAKRTMATERAKSVYKHSKNHTNEADAIVDALEWLTDEVVRNPMERGGKLYCQNCDASVDDSDTFCRCCGARLKHGGVI